MKGGKIVVEGDGGCCVGTDMKSGEIHVIGNAGIDIGRDSLGGQIYVWGEYETIGENCRAEIYHKGKLVHVK